MNAIAINFSDFIQIHNNQTVTTSEFVAKAFKKQHKHILEKIDELLSEIPADFAAAHFRETEVLRDNPLTGGKTKSRAFELTKDGFTLLAMGFTGKTALQFKIAYINAFNQMAKMLSSSLKTRTTLPNGLTIEQQDEVKAMHRAILENTPAEIRKAMAIKLWASVKQKFGCTYKAVSPEHFPEILSLLGRIAVENGIEALSGEVLDKDDSLPNKTIVLTDDELAKFATTTYYLDWATRQLKVLSIPLSTLGADTKASSAYTLWHESQIWLDECREILQKNLPNIQSNHSNSIARSLSKMEQLKNRFA